MPSPSSTLATQRPDLADSLMEFDLAMDAQGFIADKVFPVIDVASQAGTYGKIPLEELLTEIDTKRNPKGGYARDDFEFETATYATVEHGAEDLVDARESKMYAEYFDAEVVAASRAYSKVLRNAEKRVADLVFDTSFYTGGQATAAGTAWSTLATADPAANVETAVNAIYDRTGQWANALILNRKEFRNVRNVAAIIDRINSAGAGDKSTAQNITTAQLAEVFDLKYIFIAGASRNSADRNQAAAPAQIWADNFAMVCKVAETNDFKEACIGRTFHWAEDGSSIGGTVEQYYEEKVRSDVYRVRHDTDEVRVYPELGQLITGV